MKVSLVTLMMALMPFQAFCLDQKDPKAVAAAVIEAGVVFKYQEIQEYYCPESLPNWKLAVKAGELVVAHFKDSYGIDYYGQEFHDFSGFQYDVEPVNATHVLVYVTGTCTFGFTDTNFKTKKEINDTVYLRQDPQTGAYCYLRNTKENVLGRSSRQSGR